MTNIEFLVKLKAEIARCGKTIALEESCLGDIDALESLVKKFREM